MEEKLFREANQPWFSL